MNDNILKQPPLPNAIQFRTRQLPNAIQFHTRQNDGLTEVMRITRDEIWVNPFLEVDEAAKAVLDALSYRVKVLVQKAVEEEREACAKVCEKERNDLLWREGQTLPQGEPRLIHMANTAGHCAEAIRARGEK